MKSLILIPYLLLIFKYVNGQDHLEPNSNLFDTYDYRVDYHSRVRELLLTELPEQTLAQLIITPSFSKELAWHIGYDRDDKKYYSVISTPNHSIWYNQFEEKPKRLKQEISQFEISKEIAELIQGLFLAAVNTVKYGEERQGFDGVTFYFSAVDFEIKSGYIWSPRKGTVMEELVDVSQELITETQTQKVNLSEELITRVKGLILELKR